VSDQSQTDDKPEYVGKRERSRRIVLEDPIRYRGKVYEAITVKRLNAAQVADWVDAVKGKEGEEAEKVDLGNVVDDDGLAVPRQVMEFLDDDDDLKVSEAISDFLPRRLSSSSDSEQGT
jgi:hypothetical protein